MKERNSISYDLSLYNSEGIRKWAELYEKRLPKDVTFLISAGISGAAIASAILMVRPGLAHINVRPEKHVSHRGTIKNFSGYQASQGYGAFVDDFIDSGETIRKAIASFMKNKVSATAIYTKIKCIILSGHVSDTEQIICDDLGLPILFANGSKGFRPTKAVLASRKKMVTA